MKLEFTEKEIADFLQMLVNANVPVQVFLTFEAKVNEAKGRENKELPKK